jgi:rod shape-determining protein MreC
MRNLLSFLAKYNNLIIFLFLEGISFYFLSTRNNYHNTQVVNWIRSLTHGFEERISNARTYFNLREINESLSAENAALRNSFEHLSHKGDDLFFAVTDTIYSQKYVYTPAEVIVNSVNRQKNFFTINKGEKDGLTPDMAVISGNGVAGVIVGCSENYSVAMSVLNLDFRLSARIRSNGYFGSLSWEGDNYAQVVLSEIPQHVTVNIGDTIETTGYSVIFPEGFIVGTISDFEKPGGDFYRIKVSLETDFKKLHFVNVIGNLKRDEELELENLFK